MTAEPGAQGTGAGEARGEPTSPAAGERDAGAVRVVLAQAPVRTWLRSQAHNAELVRELSLVAIDQARPGSRDLPRRLLELIDGIEGRYAALAAGANAAREEAAAAGRPSVDAEYHVPAAVARDAAENMVELGRLLDEADEICRQGDELLTLPAPPEVVAFRHWFIREVVRQLDGGSPVPWAGAAD